jgi:hypothetical protein
MAYGKDERGSPDMYENLREGGYSRKEHIAEDLVEHGDCANYTEAYKVLDGMKSGQVIQTHRGFMKKE